MVSEYSRRISAGIQPRERRQTKARESQALVASIAERLQAKAKALAARSERAVA